jgi:preprotein translocase subunit SecG
VFVPSSGQPSATSTNKDKTPVKNSAINISSNTKEEVLQMTTILLVVFFFRTQF